MYGIWKKTNTEQSKREMRKTKIYFMTFVHTNDILEMNIVLSSRVPELLWKNLLLIKPLEINNKKG